MMKIRRYAYLTLIIVLMSCNSIDKRNKQQNEIKDTNIIAWNKLIKYKNNQSKKNQQKKDIWTIERLYKEEPYPFDTILKNGYNLHFEYNIEKDTTLPKFSMMLTLNKKNKIIDTLNSQSAHLRHRSLGYIGTDFNDYFVFLQSSGFLDPEEMQLLRKCDAKKMVNGYFVDADEKNEIILYNKGYDSLMFYDIKKKKNNFIVNVNNCNFIDFNLSEFHNKIKIKKVTNSHIYIEISQNSGKTILKKYYR